MGGTRCEEGVEGGGWRRGGWRGGGSAVIIRREGVLHLGWRGEGEEIERDGRKDGGQSWGI